MFVIFCQLDKLITVCIWSINNAGRYFLYVCEYVIVRFERSVLMIVMKNVHSLCILMEIKYFFINFTREAYQKSAKSLAWNSQQPFLLSSPGPTKDTEKQVYR